MTLTNTWGLPAHGEEALEITCREEFFIHKPTAPPKRTQVAME